MTKKHDSNVTGATNDSPSDGDGNTLADFVHGTVDRLQELGVDITDFRFDETNGRLSFHFEVADEPKQ